MMMIGFAMNADGVNLPALLENRGQQVSESEGESDPL